MTQQKSSSGSFFFGLLLGAIIGAVIAIYIYKNNRSKVLENFKDYLNDYLKKFTTPSDPAPKPVVAKAVIPHSVKRKPKMFIKK